MTGEINILRRKINREKAAREEAEYLLEQKSAELYESNKKLTVLNGQLNELLEEKTQKLQWSEQEYQSLVENINDIICKTDLRGEIKFVNPITQTIIGYAASDMIGRNIFRFVPNKYYHETKRYYINQFKKGVCYSYREIPIQQKNGDSLWLGLNVQFHEEKCAKCSMLLCAVIQKKPLPAKSNCQFKEVIIVARDITSQKQTEQLLTLQSKRLERGLIQQELLSEITLELNSLKNFETRVNNALQRIGEYTHTSRVYIFEDFNQGESARNTFEWCNRGIQARKSEFQDLAYRNIPSWKKNLIGNGLISAGSQYDLPADLRAFPGFKVKSLVVYPIYIQEEYFGFIGFEDHKVVDKWQKSEIELLRTVSGIIANVFQRQIVEQNLLSERDKANKANKAKSEFLANMSHEIRTPMNAILGLSEALYDRLELEGNRKMLKSVLSSGNLLLSLLNDILDLSKIEAGKLELIKKTTNLPELLRDLQILFSEKARSNGVDLSLSISPNFPQNLLLDDLRLKQVLFNLLGNSIKFTAKGKVDVWAEAKQVKEELWELKFGVKDTGIGIRKDQQAAIFNAFQQVYGQSDRQFGGAGLGLTITKRLVEKMDGAISVKSKYGKGAEFIVSLPGIVQIQESRQKKQAVQKNRAVQFAGSVIYVVDDIKTNIEAVENLLVSHKLKIYSSQSAKDALEKLDVVRPDLMLVDLKMPEMDGVSLAKAIKSEPKWQYIPIVAYTASLMKIEKGETQGVFNDFLAKPVSKSSLLDVLARNLSCTVSNMGVASAQIKKYDAISLPKGLSEEFIRLFTPKWEAVRNSLVLYKIEKFVNELSVFAKNNAIDFLNDYTSRLQEDLNAVDLKSLKDNLKEFGDYVEHLSNKHSNTK